MYVTGALIFTPEESGPNYGIMGSPPFAKGHPVPKSGYAPTWAPKKLLEYQHGCAYYTYLYCTRVSMPINLTVISYKGYTKGKGKLGASCAGRLASKYQYRAVPVSALATRKGGHFLAWPFFMVSHKN
jgi:hypothetical protein